MDQARKRWRKIAFSAVAAAGFAIASAVFAQAQAADSLPRVGWLDFGIGDAPRSRALEQSLREQGLVDGRTIVLERRSAGADPTRLARFAEEMVRLKVAVIIAPDPPSVEAARAATRTIPIVMRVSNDPVATGLVRSLAHPGGNITGLYSVSDELVGKRLEILRETIPGLKRVAVLWDPAYKRSEAWHRQARAAAQATGLQLLPVDARGTRPDFEAAIRSAKKQGAQALIALRNPRIVAAAGSIGELSTRHGLPAMYDEQAFVQSGGLMSYGTNLPELYRHLAGYVDKILKGGKAADLPVEQPTQFELVVNLRSAKALGIKIPQSILERADRVIE